MQRVFSLAASAGAVGVVLSAALIGSLAGCGSAEQQPTAEAKQFRPADAADGQSAAAAAPGSGSAVTEAAGDQNFNSRFASPAQSGRASSGGEATPPGPQMANLNPELRAVLEQIMRLESQQPRGNTQQEQAEDFVKNQTQRLSLAKKALAMKPDANVKQQLVMVMFEVLQQFVQAGLPNAMGQLQDFAKTMSADADPVVARLGRQAQFSANIARIASQADNANGLNGKEIAKEAKKLLDAERGDISNDTLQIVSQIADTLTQNGSKEDAADLIETIAAALAADPKRVDEAPRYSLIAKFVKMDTDTLVNNVFTEEAGAADKLVAAIQTLLAELPPSRGLLQRVDSYARVLEVTGHYDQALACYDQIGTKFGNSSDETIAAHAKEIAPAAKLRIGLVGQPFTVEGVTVDGTPLDWSAYAGKVTLVDFWATWCGPCLEEMPNVKQNFEQFHSKGFEVVGVNMDSKINDLKQFLTLQGSDIPWVTVTSQVALDGKAGEDWSKLPMAAKCGVQSIPFIVLVGRDGKVDSIHVRGPKLKTRLTQLLGEPAAGEIPSDPTQQAAPGAIPSAAKPTNGKQSRAMPAGGRLMPLSLLVAGALMAANEPAAAADEDTTINPYRAKPGLSATELIAYVHKMLDRPQAIQTREGFTAGLVDACDRILTAKPPASEADQLLAIQTKLSLVHRDACDGKKAADEQLAAFVEQLKDDARPEVSREVKFFRLEHRVLTAKEVPVSEIAPVLEAVKDFAGQEMLTAKHLRLASGTVALINRLESESQREEWFTDLGDLFAKSADKDLSRYGRKIAKTK